MKRELEEGRDYIVVSTPADMEGYELDDGSHGEPDEEEDDGEDDPEPPSGEKGPEPAPENGVGVEQRQTIHPMPDLVTVTLPRALLERAFAKAGREPLAGSELLDDKRTAAIVDVLSVLVEI